MKIGFIGLGIMGSRMAANLQKHGHSLVVFNRTRAKAEPLLGPCGTFSDSPAKVAEQVDTLFTMLANPDAVEEVALHANGFLNYLRPNALWVDSSLSTPAAAPFPAGKREKIERENYDPEFPLRWMQKDLNLTSVSAYESGVAMPVTNVAKEIYRLAMRAGHGTEDFSAIYKFAMGDHEKEPKAQP